MTGYLLSVAAERWGTPGSFVELMSDKVSLLGWLDSIRGDSFVSK